MQTFSKKITFEACGQKRTYKHNGLSGAILYWLLGSWTLEKKVTKQNFPIERGRKYLLSLSFKKK